MDAYHQQMLALVRAALDEDIGPGDITSLACLLPERIQAEIVAKSDGILSGIEPTTLAFHLVDSASRVVFLQRDGDRFGPGDRIAQIDGFNQPIMTAERTALNLLGHLSGVATITRRFVEKLNGTDCRMLDTRKTTAGQRLLEKRAVVHGGGVNHRIGLYDMVLIKDNHIAAAGSVKQAVELTREYLGSTDCREQFGSTERIQVEVEVTNEAELEEAIRAGVDRLLLDNQTPESLRQLVIRAREMNPKVKLEASGNVTLENVAAIAATGVDFISSGTLTHSVPTADFSLRVVSRIS